MRTIAMRGYNEHRDTSFQLFDICFKLLII